MQRGMVLSVLRGSLHDGPGVRTTVFLKGCPLACLWCHNPESIARAPQLAYRAHRCIGCGRCVAACPKGAHVLQGGAHTLQWDLCTACGACAAACPVQALEVYGRPMSVETVMQTIRQDVAYYRRSGGGVTLSGGEPLMQPAFARALLSAAHAEGVDTCVETCGYAAQGLYSSILPVTDRFLLDYKATDAATHRKLTGQDNALILRNLDFLYRQGARITLRCPLIPGVNDSPAHLAAILALRRRYPALAGVEVMPYHDMGIAKAQALGQTPRCLLPTATPAHKARWRQALDPDGSLGIVFP